MSDVKIVHIADVHWRGMTRHDEYERVFDTFFERLEKISPDIIYIGGDIFHTKTQNISPEIISIMGRWFERMTHYGHVVVTLGNHDGNLLNRSREDAISPIVSLLNNEHITLFKRSGVYTLDKFPNLNWCVFSCFDEAGWPDVRPCESGINIACFHGSVEKAKTDTGYELESDVDIDFFDGYDFGLLGDIHQMQFLAYRDCVDGKRRPWLAYCGSTIQQNYAESHEHGFLLWTIRDRDDFDVEFVPLQNINRFVTLDWNNDIDELLESTSRYAPGVRYRIRSTSQISQADWRRLCHRLKNERGALEIVSKINNTSDDITPCDDSMMSSVIEDLRDVKTHVKLIREFYNDDEVADVDWGDVEHILKHVLTKCSSDDDSVRNVKWSLNRLEFDNTFAYGENNIIDFSSLKGITGVFAPNAMGKSSIIGTIMYALFNTTDRGPVKNIHVINTRKHECSVKAHIGVGTNKYLISRSSRKHTNGKGVTTASTSLDFIDVTDTEISMNGIQRSDTEKKIRQHIGTADDFMLTSLAVQGGLKSFITHGATQRKAILSRFLDLNVFDCINEHVKKESMSLKGRLHDMPERNWDDMFERLDGEYMALCQKLSSIGDSLNELNSELRQQYDKLSSLKSSTVTYDDVERQRKVVDDTSTALADATAQFELYMRKRDVIQHMYDTVVRVKREFPHQLHISYEQRITELDDIIKSLSSKIDEISEDIGRRERSVLKLADIPCGDKYPKCKFIRDSYKDKVILPRLQKLRSDMMDELSERKTVYDSLINEGYIERLRRYRRIVAREDEYRRRLSHIDDKLSVYQQRLNDARRRYDDATAHLYELESSFSNVDVNDDADVRSITLRRIDKIKRNISVLDDEKTECNQKIGRIKTLRENLRVEYDEYVELSKKWRSYELIINATSKRAIPSKLLRYLIPSINVEIARVLNGVVDFIVTLDIPDDSNSMDVYIDYGDSKRVIELASGMEKMIASIAIRIALINVSSLPKTDMLIIDEGFSELDETNIAACGLLLRSLTQWFRSIMIITHIDALKDVVDNVIEIGKKGLDAYVDVK